MSMPDTYKVDVGWFKMLTDFHDRRCPCYNGEYACPCPPFAETTECRCGAVLPPGAEPRKDRTFNFKLYHIDFQKLSDTIEKNNTCIGDDGVTCFCDEFTAGGRCNYGVFKRVTNQ